MKKYRLKHKWRGYLMDLNNIDEITFLKSKATLYSLEDATTFIENRPDESRIYWTLETA